ncbi:electron-transferring-flavoprotein dehydrogenase [Candidatus Kinetoplastibacterium desouzaii TCC079E]|uniref:Electron transfer flavoprotein-ubiquinone oxidoreductase n=1 Tax=Candidatus Kinetoplastidibacterium desouzai TCC079E TaxID=1208919 RepID=M1M435_9PROT|nr:electron transfer flavoprotein-ubiquinone oxidoreductase [Candidatus Kinetoplastibacterium desouzaii]AGF46995.1 electron-transferring-flavoprotein dehydrogenase [Candidatus Kinetoplastibacterium desouzaii TCC079E]
MHDKEDINYDVLIIGGGPSGISAAIHLKQLSIKNNIDINICVIEKSPEIGRHIISGAILDIRALSELIPNWELEIKDLLIPVKQENFFYLTNNHEIKIPNYLLPMGLTNKNNYIVRLGYLIKRLADKAELLGVDILTGYVAKTILYNKENEVCGVCTGDFGINRDNNKKSNFEPGVKINATYTILAEGSRGHLGKEIIKRFNLDIGKNAQTYSLGIKEIWEIDNKNHSPGLIQHTIGWPLNRKARGGGFIYHLNNNLISVGIIIDLDYENPWISPFNEFQNYKLHPLISKTLKNSKRISYGARTITTGGLLSLPKTTFPGGILIGCEAGFLNSSRLKGIHSSMKSGMLSAESIIENIISRDKLQNKKELKFEYLFKKSWLYKELYLSRNFKLWNKKIKFIGNLGNYLEQKILKENFTYNIKNNINDHDCLKNAYSSNYIQYPKPDNILTFDKETSIMLSNIHHTKDQPNHLKLHNKNIPIEINLKQYGGPESRYCPAGVYKYCKDKNDNFNLIIEAENCIHCKTCDIKDPKQNIEWTPPQGGEGPLYNGM